MKQNTYQITVTPLTNANNEPVTAESLSFKARNHDDLFSIVERIKSRELLSADDSAAFAVGLKLFSEIVLENRDKPFFQELGPQVAVIMKVIKGGKPSQHLTIL
ncbi:MAG TPA: DUF3861 domain-containing protein [Thiolinea sp.]|nr:DUF3861 domain-containing protein [Thiolinea sp.]